MSQDYKLIEFTDSDFKDQNGNTWCDAVFEGVSEPVKWVVKDPSSVKVGETYYGHTEVNKSKKGNNYLRFKRDQKEDVAGTPENSKKEDSIHRSVALQQAVIFIGTEANFKTNAVLEAADDFYSWLIGKEQDTVAPVTDDDLKSLEKTYEYD